LIKKIIFEEALENKAEAISLYLDSLKEDEQLIP